MQSLRFIKTSLSGVWETPETKAASPFNCHGLF